MAKRMLTCIFILLSAINAYSQKPKGSDTKKVVFIAGTDSHGKGEHEHNGGSTLLSEKLKEGWPGVETWVSRNGWPGDTSVLSGADAIVIYCDGGGDHMLIPHFAGIDKLAKKGVGLVMLHFTLEIPRETGGDYFKNWIGGYFETDWSVNPVWTAEFTTLPDHPITRGVKPFAIKDEWYYHLRFTDRMKYVTPILQTLPPASTLNREEGTHTNNKFVRQEVLVDNKPQILAWAYERPGGGRGFGFTGGHIHANWKDDNFRMIVLNAIAWTAQKEIPDGGIKTKTPADGELESLTKKVN